MRTCRGLAAAERGGLAGRHNQSCDGQPDERDQDEEHVPVLKTRQGHSGIPSPCLRYAPRCAIKLISREADLSNRICPLWHKEAGMYLEGTK